MQKLVNVLCERLALNEYEGARVKLEVMRKKVDAQRSWGKHLGHGPCDRLHDIFKFAKPTADSHVVYNAVMAMLQKGQKCHVAPNMLRGVGIAMLGLSNSDGRDDCAHQSPWRAQGQMEITNFLGSGASHDDASFGGQAVNSFSQVRNKKHRPDPASLPPPIRHCMPRTVPCSAPAPALQTLAQPVGVRPL